MNSLRKIFVAAALAAGLASQGAVAATAQASFDLGAINIATFGGLSYSLNLDGVGHVSALANGADAMDTLGTVSVSGGGAAASATRSASLLGASADAATGFATADASTWQAALSLTGPGVIVVTLPYTMTVSALASSDEYGRASVGMSLYNFDTLSRDEVSASNLLMVDPGKQANKSDTLSIAFYHAGNGTATYKLDIDVVASASAVTPVPEPESALMLAAGLGMIGAVVRRRRQS